MCLGKVNRSGHAIKLVERPITAGTVRVDGCVSLDGVVQPSGLFVFVVEDELDSELVVGSKACEGRHAICLKFSARLRLLFSFCRVSAAKRASAC